MHPIFLHARNLLGATGLWLFLTWMISYYLALQLHIGGDEAVALFLPMLFIYFFFCLSNYYICIKLPLRQTNFLRLLVTQAAAGAATVCIWLTAGFGYVQLLNRLSERDWLPLYRDSLLLQGGIGVMLYGFWILSHYIYLMARQHDELQRIDLEKRLLLSQTELQAVKATLHPHFLYNSLNTLANLALAEPAKVHNICLQISEFLRYSVSYGQKDTATVGEELEHIQNYLGIERERFGKRLQTEFHVDEQARTETILPLLLFPLVENSIKHGIDSSLEGGILEIRVEKNDDALHIRVQNPIDELGYKQNGTSLGLEAVRKRVQAYYGGRGRVDISRGPGSFAVDLTLPIVRRLT